MRMPGGIAAEEGVQGVDAMHQARLDQELERAVDRGRCRLVALLGELGEDLVGADRLVRAPDDFEHALADRGEVQPAAGADLDRRGHGPVDAGTVVVVPGLARSGLRHAGYVIM